MLIDARRALPGSVFETEVCVIGSGPAGATVAAELADRGIGVIVLEGGGDGTDRTAVDTYRGVGGTGTHDPLEAVRQKRLGGSSEVWGGRCAPLDDIDLDERDWVPESGWPIAHDELRAFYVRAARHLDAGGADWSASTSGLPGVPSGIHPTDTLRWDDLWRWSPPTKFGPRVQSLATTGRLRLFLHATVARLERDPAASGANEAVVVPRHGLEIRVRAREFVLAAGGLESARILLASDGYGGSGLGPGIGNEHDQVGRHYMTHPIGEVGRLRLTEAGQAFGLDYRPTSDGVYARRMLSLSPQVQESQRLRNLKAALWFADPKEADHHDALLSTFALTYWGMGRVKGGFKTSGTHAQYAQTSDIRQHVRNVVSRPDAGRPLHRGLGAAAADRRAPPAVVHAAGLEPLPPALRRRAEPGPGQPGHAGPGARRAGSAAAARGLLRLGRRPAEHRDVADPDRQGARAHRPGDRRHVRRGARRGPADDRRHPPDGAAADVGESAHRRRGHPLPGARHAERARRVQRRVPDRGCGAGRRWCCVALACRTADAIS